MTKGFEEKKRGGGDEVDEQALKNRLILALSDIAFVKIGDFIEIKDGEAVVRADLDADKLGGVLAVENSSSGVKIKLDNRLRAMEMLQKLIQVSGAPEICDLSDIRAEIYGEAF